MQRSWFNNRLTSAKQKSLLYKSLADLVQSMMDTFVDPWLERITNRKSIFSMSKEDLETRTNELGQFLYYQNLKLIFRSDVVTTAA